MNRYKKLLSDTAIFAVGNFLVKLIQFLLMPLYTSSMTTTEYGVAELLNNSVELMYPILTLGIYEAVFRFALDKDADDTALLTNGLVVILSGFAACALLTVFVQQIINYVYLYYVLFVMFATSIRILVAQFARGIGYIKSFSISGIVNVMVLFISNVVLLNNFHMGVKGYLLSLGLGNLFSCVFLIIACRIWHYIKKPRIHWGMMKAMLLFSLPMVPNMLSWWITNLSGRYIVAGFCGVSMAGMFAAASKLPSVVNMFATIFQQAWQISSTQALDEKTDPKYFSKVFQAYWGLICLLCAAIILVLPFLAKLLLQGEFYSAWRYVPILILSSCLNCFSVYFGTLYTAAKKNKMVFVSTVLGAATNLLLCIALVPKFGVWGACIASVVGYLVIVVFRIIDTSRIVKIDLSKLFTSSCVGILSVEAVLMSLAENWSIVMAAILFGLLSIIVIYQFRHSMHLIFTRLLHRRKVN